MGPNAVVDGVQWKIREVIIRGNDREDPELNVLLLELWNHYGPKLPRLRELLESMVAEAGMDAPGRPPSSRPGDRSGVGRGAVVSEAAAANTGGSKLWIPE